MCVCVCVCVSIQTKMVLINDWLILMACQAVHGYFMP